MNCTEFREDFAAYAEGLLESESASRIESHLTDCAACRAEFEEVRRLVVRLTRAGLGAPGISLESQTMDRIIRQQALILRRLQMRKRIRFLGISGAMAAAIVLFFVAGIWMTSNSSKIQAAENSKVEAARTMAQGVKALPNVSSIHIRGKMRTLPADNFANIMSEGGELVPIELWKQFGEKPKWRVEKPGRVAVMDAESTMMLIKPDRAMKLPHPADSAFDNGWLLSLTNVRDLVKEELQTALAEGWDINLVHERDGEAKKLAVTVEAKAGLSDDNYLKNKFIDTSDTRRVYRFDAETKRLEAFHIYLHEKGKDVLIFETEEIEYDNPIDPATFSLDLPKDVVWYEEPAKLADNEKYEKMTPKEAATAFFEACSKEDWRELKNYWPVSVDERFKTNLGGLEIMSIGEPFQAKPYPGWFVPYEIKLKNGEVKKHNLAVRNDNPAKRYMVDGGI
jgi:hypothetical protein